MRAQQVSNQAPVVESALLPDAPGSSSASGLGDVPNYPTATLLPAADDGTTVVIETSGPQTRTGTRYTLDKDVVITYGDRRIEADHVDYDAETGELNASGHLKVTGGANGEEINASRGSMNLKTQTGRFFDVKGSVGLHGSHKPIYGNNEPFLFEGKVVVKTGP